MNEPNDRLNQRDNFYMMVSIAIQKLLILLLLLLLLLLLFLLFLLFKKYLLFFYSLDFLSFLLYVGGCVCVCVCVCVLFRIVPEKRRTFQRIWEMSQLLTQEVEMRDVVMATSEGNGVHLMWIHPHLNFKYFSPLGFPRSLVTHFTRGEYE